MRDFSCSVFATHRTIRYDTPDKHSEELVPLTNARNPVTVSRTCQTLGLEVDFVAGSSTSMKKTAETQH